MLYQDRTPISLPFSLRYVRIEVTSTTLCLYGKISVDLWAMSQASQNPLTRELAASSFLETSYCSPHHNALQEHPQKPDLPWLTHPVWNTSCDLEEALPVFKGITKDIISTPVNCKLGRLEVCVCGCGGLDVCKELLKGIGMVLLTLKIATLKLEHNTHITHHLFLPSPGACQPSRLGWLPRTFSPSSPASH